ncbi:hypothetical protein [Methylacidimicrobium sp. B4]|uniref:hypothetical protein n=1 Tax=Methylacidimicrobium sp. B4 TaxID=2796139 RepID=UPI001A8CE50A|nr:hypothetical protein [Methylacidimicrobium sp. B4]QSR84501.1 hypothetical protein MacB4_09910 [Methylacidimicrobium sp. B4]
MSARIVGAGAVGIDVVDEWILLSDGPTGSLACDGEASAVEGSLALEKLLLAPDLASGLGCFGGRDLAWRMVGQENQRLEALLKDCSRLLIVTGLAGATGATVTEALALKAVEREISTTVFAILPFPFETEERQAAAQATRDALPAEASLFLFPPPTPSEEPTPDVTAVRRRLREFQSALAQWVDVWSGMARGVVSPAHWGGRAETSPFTVAGAIEDCQLFAGAGPRLDLSLLGFLEASGFRQAAEKADRCLASIEAHDEVSGGEEELANRLQKFLPKRAHLDVLRRTAARSTESRILLLVGRDASRHPKAVYPERDEREPAPEPERAPIRRVLAEPEGRLVPASQDGTPFAKTAATLHKGENLDIPAFRRRKREPGLARE